MVVLEAGVVVTVINVVLKSENVLDKLFLGLFVVLVLLSQRFQLNHPEEYGIFSVFGIRRVYGTSSCLDGNSDSTFPSLHFGGVFFMTAKRIGIAELLLPGMNLIWCSHISININAKIKVRNFDS